MADNTALAKPEFRTSLIKTQDQYLGMIEQQMAAHRIVMDEYQKACVMNALSAISTAMDKTGVQFNHADVDQTSITQILLTVAALRLNASATPREVYFQVRNTKKTVRNAQTLDKKDNQTKYIKVVEMGIEGDGNDALLRRFGAGIAKIGHYWLVREGDEFTPPRYKGMAVEPPVWQPKGGSGRVIAVVYPILKQDGCEEYHMAYRADVKANLLAHISNNMMNETFGLAADRYNASPDQLKKIAAKKSEIIDRAAEMTLDEILDDKSLADIISPAWREPHSREKMIIRKMRNNITKPIPKDFGSGFVAGQYEEQRDEDEREITKDAGGDSEPAPLQMVDVTVPVEAVEAVEAPPAITVTPAPVKPPKAHPKPLIDREEPLPEPPHMIADDDQLGLGF